MARAATTTDVFNAIAQAQQRGILYELAGGERPVGAIVDELAITQPQVSKHLRVLSEVGLVQCRAAGRRHLYRVNPTRLRPVVDWLSRYEHLWNERLDRLDDYLGELQRDGSHEDHRPQGAP